MGRIDRSGCGIQRAEGLISSVKMPGVSALTPVQDRRTDVIWLLLTSNPAGVTEKEVDESSPKGT